MANPGRRSRSSKVLEQVMFTGIIQILGNIKSQTPQEGFSRVVIELPEVITDFKVGASVAVNGVCLTIVQTQPRETYTDLHFDVVSETARITNLGSLQTGNLVHVERSLKIGDEIGGHLVSGHVMTQAQMLHLEGSEHAKRLEIALTPEWNKYLFTKGFLAVDGVSLTIAEVLTTNETAFVFFNIIPETLKRTRLRQIIPGNWLNIEIDQQTKTIVDSVERVLLQKSFS